MKAQQSNMEKQDKLPIETTLGNFANAAQTIERMKGGEAISFHPTIGTPYCKVVCNLLGNGARTFTVNGVDVGNSHGAVGAMVMLLAPAIAAALQNAPPHREESCSNEYYAKLRTKLFATLA